MNGQYSPSSGPAPSVLKELKQYYKSSAGYRAHLDDKEPNYFQQFVAVVRKYSSPHDRILDLGCGTGESTRQITQQNRRVIGADLSRLFMESRGTFGSSRQAFVASDASRLPFPDASIDLVCAMEFIEHVWPVEPVLHEMDRILKPSGRIVLMSPNLLSPMWPLRDLPGMLLQHRFRPPFYSSLPEAAAFFRRSSVSSMRKMLSANPCFLGREPDLQHADHGGDFDSIYYSNARDLLLFFRKVGYQVQFVRGDCNSFQRWVRRSVAKLCGSFWTSFLLLAVKAMR